MQVQRTTLVTLIRVFLITTSVIGPNYRSVVSHSAHIMLWKGPGEASFLRYAKVAWSI